MSDLKSFREVAISKKLEMPSEETGLVFNKSLARVSEGAVETLAELYPNDKELALINKGAVLAQKPDRWIVLRNVNPLGIAEQPDSDNDVFSKLAQEDMKAQGKKTPVLQGHDHAAPGPPAGMCIDTRMTKDGLRETLAFPIEIYNEDVIRGVLNGTYCHLSVGVLVKPQNKICTACEKSIYSYACPHEYGDSDAQGNPIIVRIDRVERYLERSLVHVPARLNTSTKAFQAQEELDQHFAALKGPSELLADITLNDPQSFAGAEVPIHTYGDETPVEGLEGTIVPQISEKSDPDTIETVNKTIEDSIVADKAQDQTKEVDVKAVDEKTAEDVKAAEDTSKAAEDVKAVDEKSAEEKAADEKAAEEAKAMEDEKAKKPADDNDADDKSVISTVGVGMDATPKALDAEVYTKSFEALEASTKKFEDATSKAVSFEATVKGLVEANKAQGETIAKLLEAASVSNKHMEAQNERIEKLLELQETLAKSVQDALQVSSQETLEALSELVNSVAEQGANNKSASLDLKSSDWTKQLLSFGQQVTK